jgi:beta-galactosidase
MMKPKPFIDSSVQLGVCYYPEHVPASECARDLDRIAEAGMSIVRVGEGAWWYWEPREGEFRFELFDRVIELCGQRGLGVVMGTPTYAAPAWVMAKYPDVLRWDFSRRPMMHGSRRNLTYNSASYNRLSDRVTAALAEHYKDCGQIIAWQIDNEFNCHMDATYAPCDTQAFRAFLQERYHTLEALNEAWGTRFWSQVYDCWEQIDLPGPTSAYANPHQLLDEARFISWSVTRYCTRQANVLRQANPNWLITHNGLFNNVDGPALRRCVDLFCHDHYPQFSPDWPAFSRQLAQARSLSQPFAIMEQQGGAIGQLNYLFPTPTPAMLRAWSMQSIAHGARTLVYFLWRTCPFGTEQHCHGLIEHDGTETPALAMVRELAREVKSLPASVVESPVRREVAILRDFDNEIHAQKIQSYAGDLAWPAWYAALVSEHVPADMVWLAKESTWHGLRVLIAPHLRLVEPGDRERLLKWVEQGGQLLLGPEAMTMDRRGHLLPLRVREEFTGVRVAQWSNLARGTTRALGRDIGSMSGVVEDYTPMDMTTMARAIWQDNANLAVARRSLGTGAVWSVGGVPDAKLIAWLLRELEAKPALTAPREVEAIERENGWLWLVNHSAEPVELSELATTEMQAGAPASGRFRLAAYGTAGLQRV